ncbi:hypothetical protein HHK36_022445 [Tetracentron sinense]|uniref:Uncharacterized protein n=1 Tax=Tetracentron sinense TaxID=13715 RepID=A0A835D638_TETSI|nr:hypothetical protein HHK36_022445 [Tetracentron sinense]
MADLDYSSDVISVDSRGTQEMGEKEKALVSFRIFYPSLQYRWLTWITLVMILQWILEVSMDEKIQNKYMIVID